MPSFIAVVLLQSFTQLTELPLQQYLFRLGKSLWVVCRLVIRLNIVTAFKPFQYMRKRDDPKKYSSTGWVIWHCTSGTWFLNTHGCKVNPSPSLLLSPGRSSQLTSIRLLLGPRIQCPFQSKNTGPRMRGHLLNAFVYGIVPECWHRFMPMSHVTTTNNSVSQDCSWQWKSILWTYQTRLTWKSTSVPALKYHPMPPWSLFQSDMHKCWIMILHSESMAHTS